MIITSQYLNGLHVHHIIITNRNYKTTTISYKLPFMTIKWFVSWKNMGQTLDYTLLTLKCIVMFFT